LSDYNPNFVKKIFHQARRIIAKRWLKLCSPVQIAITGSQGKTNVRNILANLFQNAIITDLNLDTIFNVPITALKVRLKSKLAIFELGIDHKKEMEKHLEIVSPNISVITGISKVHSDENLLGSFENIISEKRKIIENLTEKDFAILNYDDENVREMAKFTKGRVLFFGSDSDHCEVFVKTKSGKVAKNFSDLLCEISENGTSFEIFEKNRKSLKVETKLIGKHHIYNILASFLVYKVYWENFNDLKSEKIFLKAQDDNSEQKIQDDNESVWDEKKKKVYDHNQGEFQNDNFLEIIKNLEPLKGRMSVEKLNEKIIILDDSLRANPKSTEAGLTTLSEMRFFGKKIAVLSEMGELGKYAEDEHRKIGELVVNLENIDFVIFVGALQKLAYEKAKEVGFDDKEVFWFENVVEAGIFLKKEIFREDQNRDEKVLIYLKSSRLKHSERILMILKDEKVGCKVLSCPLFNHCSVCKFLEKGYRE